MTLNKELIFLYSENARAKIRDLANILKKSPQRLKYSFKILEKEGIIHNPYSIFDYSYFGLVLFRVYFKGGYISEKDKEEIIKKLRENQYIVSMYELSGFFDLAIEIESPNPSRFNKELKKIANLIPTLNSYKIILNVVTHIYPRSYLINNNELMNNVKQEIIVGGDRGLEKFNENEMIIMKNLLNNPKLRLMTLAKQTNLNVKTVKSVLKNLEKKKIIKGFKYITNTEKLDIYKFRLFLHLHNLSQEREKQLMDFMLNTQEIVQVNKTVGDWDMEVDIESFDRARIRHLTIHIRENFKDLIETFNIIEFYQYYKKSYLPLYLFSQDAEQSILQNISVNKSDDSKKII